METRIENLEKAIHKIEVAMGMKEEEIENKSKELEKANAEIQNKSEEIAKLKATKTDAVAKNEETKIGSEKSVDPNLAFFNAMVKSIQRIA